MGLHRSGALDQAADAYRRILGQAPRHADALNLLGVIEFERKNFDAAVDLLSRAVASNPNHADAHTHLGAALMAAGRAAEALPSLRRAVELRPDFAGAHHNLGLALIKTGDPAAAVASARRAVELSPNYAEAHHSLATALRRSRNFGDADRAYRMAISLRPTSLPWLRDYAAFLTEINQFERSMAVLDSALALAPKDVQLRLARAEVLFRKLDIAAAEAEYRELTEQAPAIAAAWNGLGRSQMALGRFAKAAASFRQALACDPGMAEAHRYLALMSSAPADDSEIERLASYIDGPGAGPIDRIAAGFALGKKLDDAGRYDDAFSRYRAANIAFRDLRMAYGRRFDPKECRRGVDDLIAAPLPQGAAVVSDLPVFIVGMPRSGTSLVEQIAASHPSVFGAGELTDIGTMAAGGGAPDAARAGEHVARLQALAPNALRVVDKTPDNILHLGRIARMFDRPRVIFCQRDPRDTCLSCYFTLFTSGNLWSFDLEDCGFRHFEIDRLARHWIGSPALRVLTVQYEALVGDLEGEGRRIIDFLGLPWDPVCLRFHETERAVATPSFWQVRQPIYSKSVGRWQAYEKHLAPLLVGLSGAHSSIQ